MHIGIISIIIGIIIFIVSVVVIKRKQMEVRSYYDAAMKMMKEEYLTETLQLKRRRSEQPAVTRMIYLKLCKNKGRQRYVFNPKKEIVIGRSKKESSIWISSPDVSMIHCKIFEYNGEIYLQDLQSANGTVVKRGLRKIVLFGQVMALASRDKILIGEEILKIIIFDFRMM